MAQFNNDIFPEGLASQPLNQDWVCACTFLNFARRTCQRCGQVKPATFLQPPSQCLPQTPHATKDGRVKKKKKKEKSMKGLSAEDVARLCNRDRSTLTSTEDKEKGKEKLEKLLEIRISKDANKIAELEKELKAVRDKVKLNKLALEMVKKGEFNTAAKRNPFFANMSVEETDELENAIKVD